jgi:HEAT repeat protein
MDAAQLLPRFESAFKDAVPIVRMTAVQLVPYLGAEGQALDPALIAALKDDAAMVRHAALQAVGPATPEAVPVIMESLGDPDLQPKIIDALTKIGAAAEPAVPRLLELLPTASKETRLKILAAVAIIGSQAGLPALVHAMKDEDAEIRTAAIVGYAKAEHEPAAVLAAAIAMLTDPNREVRHAAASALAQLGDRARSAAPQLLVLLDSDEDRAFALEALRRTQPRAVPQLLPLLNHRDQGVRVFACERLGRLGADAREAIPALQQLAGAQSQPESVQREARRALRQIEQK